MATTIPLLSVIAECEGLIEISRLLNGFRGHHHGLAGGIPAPISYGPRRVLPCARIQNSPCSVSMSEPGRRECDACIPAQTSRFSPSVKTCKGTEAMRVSAGRGVRYLPGYGFDPIREFSEAAKIPASNLPPVQRMEDVQLHMQRQGVPQCLMHERAVCAAGTFPFVTMSDVAKQAKLQLGRVHLLQGVEGSYCTFGPSRALRAEGLPEINRPTHQSAARAQYLPDPKKVHSSAARRLLKLKREEIDTLGARRRPDRGSEPLQRVNHVLAARWRRNLTRSSRFGKLLPGVGPRGVEHPIAHRSRAI